MIRGPLVLVCGLLRGVGRRSYHPPYRCTHQARLRLSKVSPTIAGPRTVCSAQQISVNAARTRRVSLLENARLPRFTLTQQRLAATATSIGKFLRAGGNAGGSSISGSEGGFCMLRRSGRERSRDETLSLTSHTRRRWALRLARAVPIETACDAETSVCSCEERWAPGHASSHVSSPASIGLHATGSQIGVSKRTEELDGAGSERS